MDPILARYLAGRTHVAVGRVCWRWEGAPLPLECRTFLVEEAPPRALVTSVRAIVRRRDQVLVVWDPEGRHILPGGRIEPGESYLETLERELLEETGWQIQHPPHLMALSLYEILSPCPRNYPHPYPHFAQLIYRAEARTQRPTLVEVDGYEIGAGFLPQARARSLPLSPGEKALLDRLTPGG